MSDFWGLSSGDTATDTGTEYEVPGGGNFDPIPDGSSVLAMIDEAEWRDVDGDEHLSLRWTILAPDEFKNRKVFQKLFVTDDDPRAKDAAAAARKRDKAKRMLAAIDGNCGGKLLVKPEKPTVENMTRHLANKPMTIKLLVWEMPDRDRPGGFISGNWICAVGPKSKGVDMKDSASRPSVDDDEIPF